MLDSFASFIIHGKALAAEKNQRWSFDLDDKGKADLGWNLTELTGGFPPVFYLRDFSADAKVLPLRSFRPSKRSSPALLSNVLSEHWQDLLKAATCDQLFFHRNTPRHVAGNVIRPLRILATCAGKLEPWQLTTDVVHEAFEISNKIQPCGKLADMILGLTNTLIDANHLSENCPLYPAVSSGRLKGLNPRKSKISKSRDELLDELSQRKRGEKLPEKRAFWELIRIVFTEKPKSFTDALRFAALKTMVITGLRIGEVVRLPADWKRFREYYDAKGRPAGELGGYSQSLMLRHFAEKQQDSHGDSTVLFENVQFVPNIFEEILTETLDDVLRITAPLRDTLRLQVESGRILPWYEPNKLIPVLELYPRITGNLFWLDIPSEIRDQFIARYREAFSPDVLNDAFNFQWDGLLSDGMPSKLGMPLYMYYNRLFSKAEAPTLRQPSGAEYTLKSKPWKSLFLKVGELEKYLAESVPTKVPDIKPLKLMDGEIQSWELMFLLPKRALAEERNDGVTDISRYYSVGMADTGLLVDILGEDKDGRNSIFDRYSESDEDRKLVITSHSFRHLQNTVLFRQGITDSIISKRFNRRSVAQSYEYDHRSLAEDLDDIELPLEVAAFLGPKPTIVAKLILTGKASGPIVDEFKRIQKQDGYDAAFDFLRIEADGLHVTPYGTCVNSFSVDPCPKNLECFAGCRHLISTGTAEDKESLCKLKSKMVVIRDDILSKPVTSIGRSNQLAHVEERIKNIEIIEATPAGERAFPDGPDLSRSNIIMSVLDE